MSIFEAKWTRKIYWMTTRKHLIWYGHVERKIMIHWKPEGRKKQGRPLRTWKDGIYTAMNERDLRMGE
jgi:hypothetical protein